MVATAHISTAPWTVQMWYLSGDTNIYLHKDMRCWMVDTVKIILHRNYYSAFLEWNLFFTMEGQDPYQVQLPLNLPVYDFSMTDITWSAKSCYIYSKFWPEKNSLEILCFCFLWTSMSYYIHYIMRHRHFFSQSFRCPYLENLMSFKIFTKSIQNIILRLKRTLNYVLDKVTLLYTRRWEHLIKYIRSKSNLVDVD